MSRNGTCALAKADVKPLMIALRSAGSICATVYSASVAPTLAWNTAASATRNAYMPNARRRTAPNSLSRIVIGCCVPHRCPVWTRVEKKYTSLLNGDWKALSQFWRFVSSGRFAVTSVCSPGANRSAARPSFTKSASCDSRTVSLPPLWISMSCMGKRYMRTPGPDSVH